MQRSLVLAILLVTATLAGCVDPLSPDGDLGASSTLEGLPPLERILDDTLVTWYTDGAAETFQGHLAAPSTAGAVFAEVHYTAADPTTHVTLTVEAPDGTTFHLLEDTHGSGSDWAILPGVAGTWNTTVEAEGVSRGNITLTAVAQGPTPEAVTPTGAGGDRTVVAVVDTGVNPYHEAFHAQDLATGNLPARVQDVQTGQGPVSVPVAPHDGYMDSLRTDAGVWTQVPSRTLVHFEGTNVLGYHLDETRLPNLPVLDRAGHGTMVSHAVTNQNPDVLVVMVTGSDYDEGVAWAASQPWIDLISLSWGPVVNAAGVAEPYAFGFRTAEVTLDAWSRGQVVFTATGNDPTPAFTDTTSGPPWVHAVSGSNGDTHGRNLMSGNLVDTVANWTQTLATYDTLDGERTASGTSFATPLTAGVASRILHEVRAEAGHEGGITPGGLLVDAGSVQVTNGDLRQALNTTAVYWSTTDYDGPGEPWPTVPATPGAPWVSMGWGHVDGRVVTSAVAGLLGEEPLPEKPAEAVAYMEANEDVRAGYWELR